MDRRLAEGSHRLEHALGLRVERHARSLALHIGRCPGRTAADRAADDVPARLALTGGSRYGHGARPTRPKPKSSARRSEPWLEANLPDGWFEPGFELSPEERQAFNEDWPKRLYEGGWICASWPEEYGGKNLTIMENVVLAEEFARAKAPLRADFFGDTLVGPTILQWGTDEQKTEFLPKIQRGEMRWCQGFSEPDSGSDLASLKTTAVLDGDEWIINGQKVWTTRAQHADYVFLLARTDPGGRQAQGHLVPARAHEAAGDRGPPDHPARRHGGVQRGLLRRRPLPAGQRGRRGQQRLGRGQHDARPRAGDVRHDRPPPLRGGARD